MPLFLRLVMLAGGPMGALGAVFILIFLSLAAGDIGPYTVNGARVGMEEFFTFAVPVMGSYLILFMTLVSTAWGLYHRRPWSRPSFMSLGVGFVLVGVCAALFGGAPLGAVGSAIFMSALMLGSLWWYLYRDDAVVNFFDSLDRPEEGIQ